MRHPSVPALFIGRFQPFHLGHLDALHQIFEQEDFVIIGIGSADDKFTPENPFTAEERIKMIRSTLDEDSITDKVISIILIPDIDDSTRWVSHVRRLCPPFGTVYTGSPIVKDLFEKDGRNPVYDLKFRKDISATQVREHMTHSEPVEYLLPSSVADLLIRWDADTRLKEIS